MRHLLIGNSHLAALKLGWDKIAKSHSNTELVFTGARGEQLRRLHLDGDVLTSDSPRGRRMMKQLAGSDDPIDVTGFDTCWIVGGQFSVVAYVQLYSNFRSERHDDLGDNIQILSEQAFNLAARSALADASGIALARSLAAHGVAVGIIPQPMPSHNVIDARRRWRAAGDPQAQKTIAELFTSSLRALVADLPATLALQPADTLETPITTKVEFARGSSGLTENAHDDDDVVHMNGAYGQRVIETHLLH